MKRNSTQPKRQLINDNGRNRNDTIEKRGVDLEPRGETKGQRKRKRAKKKRKIIFRSRHQMRTLLTRHLWLATMDIWRCLLSLANEKRGPRDKWCRLTIACRITQFMIHNASLGRIHISTRAHTHTDQNNGVWCYQNGRKVKIAVRAIKKIAHAITTKHIRAIVLWMVERSEEQARY